MRKRSTKARSGTLRCRVGEESARLLRGDQEISLQPGQPLRVDLASGGSWYGHGFAHRQPYPLNAEPIVNPSFAVNNTQSPVWMCSAGFVIVADTTETLSVRCNEGGNGQLEIVCPTKPLTLRLFSSRKLPAAHRKFLKAIHWPPAAPAKKLLGDSIFCTWTQYPRCITQERIVDMARAIRAHGYPCSVITIDDRWESAFGELTFSKDFPDPKAMVSTLHDLGFRVLLWVTPFINQEARTFSTLAEQRFLVPRRDGAGPSLLKWWGGTAGLVDLTNPSARQWYKDQLLRLKNEVGADGFKIDGGDAKYQPDLAASAWHRYAGPSGYSDLLLTLFEEVAPGLCETRTAWMSQSRNILWRQGGKDSHWGIDNGLKAMVTLGLHMSLLGYDLFIPDMIPGRVQTMVSDMPLPTDEFFIRWIEASAVMPLMQFSYFPWNYAEPTAQIARQYAELHKALEDYLHRQATGRTAPLYRPLWYDWPGRPEFYGVADQFMLGDDLMAAPVLAENQVARPVLLPPGGWRDAWTGEMFADQVLASHPAPCPGIPLFVRASNRKLFATVHRMLAGIPCGTITSGSTTTTYRCGLDRDLKVTG